MAALMNRSAFYGSQMAATHSVQKSEKKAMKVTAVVGPQVSWDSGAAGHSHAASRMIERLERRARAAAAVAAERVLLSEPTPTRSAGFLNQQHSRLKEWWSDHLAIRASAVEAATGTEEGEKEGEIVDEILVKPVLTTRVREAENDRARDSLREFYYPRSDPAKYN